MNIPNINTILSRDDVYSNIREFLLDFERNKHDLTKKRGIYLYGGPGCGKTTFIKNLLKDMNYDSLVYDAGDIRNKGVIEKITKNNQTDVNVMSCFYAKRQSIAIIMDEIDGMNSGDKGGLNTLIKLIRPKKTKKQKTEDIAKSPIICISNYHSDKKIKELMKVCEVFELKKIEDDHITNILDTIIPELPKKYIDYISSNSQGDLRRLEQVYKICKYHIDNNIDLPSLDIIRNILHPKTFNEDTKQTVFNLFNQPYRIEDHLVIMNETDRTIVGLLWHENIIDVFTDKDKKTNVEVYINFLENICFADYIDRITFQKQIWQFNELSSLMKTFYNSKLLHDYYNTTDNNKNNKMNDIRFTKVLTKYSTEYNNSVFIQNLCQKIGMDKKDMFVFFKSFVNKQEDASILTLLDTYELSKLDINRITRYLEKHASENKEIHGSHIDYMDMKDESESIDIGL
jgi:DNA polymerase III delta prime subunit|uniref:AAA+ ATPase domain-containing protein n=1 Tax=viral metagenome TaxID=1070528 RepID=A0A6C0IL59_9ZZZZ